MISNILERKWKHETYQTEVWISSRSANRSNSAFGFEYDEMIIPSGVIEITCKETVAAYFKIIQAFEYMCQRN
jgi:hypothetical protein